MFTVGRPEVVGADVQFFGVHPIDLAVQHVVLIGGIFHIGGVFSELLLAFSFYRLDVQVVITNVGQARSVRRKLGIAIRLRRGGELNGGTGVQRVKPELAVRVE